MTFDRFLQCLEADFRRMREISSEADMDRSVPSCPEWNLGALVEHTARVYLHKVASTELGREPEDWPPDLSGQTPLESLDDAYAKLTGMFAAHEPSDHSGTWYDPDQTVGFWIRRMAQETVIHRRDAELAVGKPTPAAEDLAIDGIAELLDVFLSYGTSKWASECRPQLEPAVGDVWLIDAGSRRWQADVSLAGVEISDPSDAPPAVTVRGEPSDVLFWLWNRRADGDGPVEVSGDADALRRTRDLLELSTQ